MPHSAIYTHAFGNQLMKTYPTQDIPKTENIHRLRYPDTEISFQYHALPGSAVAAGSR